MREENTIQKNFIDEKGERATITIESQNSYNTNLNNNTYKLAENMHPKNNPLVKTKHENILNSDIGFKSGGFAQVAVLAAITAIAGLIFAYLTLRF